MVGEMRKSLFRENTRMPSRMACAISYSGRDRLGRNNLRSSARRAEVAIARVADARDDVSPGIQARVDGRGEDL